MNIDECLVNFFDLASKNIHIHNSWIAITFNYLSYHLIQSCCPCARTSYHLREYLWLSIKIYSAKCVCHRNMWIRVLNTQYAFWQPHILLTHTYTNRVRNLFLLSQYKIRDKLTHTHIKFEHEEKNIKGKKYEKSRIEDRANRGGVEYQKPPSSSTQNECTNKQTDRMNEWIEKNENTQEKIALIIC